MLLLPVSLCLCPQGQNFGDQQYTGNLTNVIYITAACVCSKGHGDTIAPLVAIRQYRPLS